MGAPNLSLRALCRLRHSAEGCFAGRRNYSTRLAEVGKFEAQHSDKDYYPAGQTFLHRIFGYRGVIIFPWLARVHDNDLKRHCTPEGGGGGVGGANSNKSSSAHNNQMAASTAVSSTESHVSDDGESHRARNQKSSGTRNHNRSDGQGGIAVSRNTSAHFHPYYQVLIDMRDCPFMVGRTETNAVTYFSRPDNSTTSYKVNGLDYVAHEDIMPYTSFEEQPIEHELHHKLFTFDADIAATSGQRYVPSKLLETWRNKHPWLELSRVYRETTENVRVTVIPFYLGHATTQDTPFHWWRYCIRLENFGEKSVQVRERNFKIISQTNTIQTIKGRGVGGGEPLLTKSEPAFQFSSHLNLQDKKGQMSGTFKMQREDGYTFDCRMPPFALESSSS